VIHVEAPLFVQCLRMRGLELAIGFDWLRRRLLRSPEAGKKKRKHMRGSSSSASSLPSSSSFTSIPFAGKVESPGDNEPYHTDGPSFRWRQEMDQVEERKGFSLCSLAVLSCVLYSIASISMVLSNKLILTTFQFKYDMVLLFIQNCMSTILLRAARSLGWCEFEEFEARKALDWLPLNFFFIGMLLTGFFSLEMLSVPMMTIFKNSSNVLVTFGDYAIYGRTVSRGVVACLVLMIIAAIFAALHDITLEKQGIMWALCNCAVSASYVLYMPRAMKKTKLSNFGKVYYNSALSLPLILVLDGITSNDFIRLYRSKEDLVELRSWSFLFTLIFSGFVGAAISLASFNCVRRTSPTTYSMVGSMNKIPLSLLGVLIFRTHLTFRSGVFIALSLLAGILYAYTKAKEEEKKKKRKKSVADLEKAGLSIPFQSLSQSNPSDSLLTIAKS